MRSPNRYSKNWGGWLLVVVAILFVSNGYAAAKPSQVLEIIGKPGQPLNAHTLVSICAKAHVPATDLYQWHNHLVISGVLKNINELKKQVADKYPDCEFKLYDRPFYNFTRAERCGKLGLAKEWDNIILTCNLVDDPKMQQEYLNYHATQFQKWPQVSQGFCNAGFQQLLVFKNGRQLMLIISIPRGESFDKLNAKTTENNPKVDEWNKLMAKYQEGVPGTKKGESWVFFKPVGNN